LELTRAQVASSVTQDALIIQASNALEDLDKISNNIAKRLREWHALYDPKTERSFSDHDQFVSAIVHEALSPQESRSMGGQLSEQDLRALRDLAKLADQTIAQRRALITYIEERMRDIAPNISAVATPTLGARLLALAGGLQRMAYMPASTIQLLGAETALFRHLRNRRSKPPKHGIIFNHPLLQRSPPRMRGKVARTLADKISIAARVDHFHGEFVGDRLLSEAEAKVRQ
jgi:nucleolar protein 56